MDGDRLHCTWHLRKWAFSYIVSNKNYRERAPLISNKHDISLPKARKKPFLLIRQDALTQLHHIHVCLKLSLPWHSCCWLWSHIKYNAFVRSCNGRCDQSGLWSLTLGWDLHPPSLFTSTLLLAEPNRSSPRTGKQNWAKLRCLLDQGYLPNFLAVPHRTKNNRLCHTSVKCPCKKSELEVKSRAKKHSCSVSFKFPNLVSLVVVGQSKQGLMWKKKQTWSRTSVLRMKTSTTWYHRGDSTTATTVWLVDEKVIKSSSFTKW